MWQIQEAKNKFSQVIAIATDQGPQIITRHGMEVAVLLSYRDYKKMLSTRQGKQKKLSNFFRESPLVNLDLNLSRDQSDARSTLEL